MPFIAYDNNGLALNATDLHFVNYKDCKLK